MQEDFDKYGVDSVIGFSQAGGAYNGASGAPTKGATGENAPITASFTSVYAKKPERPSGQMFGVLVCADREGKEVVLKAFSGQYKSVWNIPGWAPPLLSESEFARLTEKSDREIHELSAQIEAIENKIKACGTVGALSESGADGGTGVHGKTGGTHTDGASGVQSASSETASDGLSEKLRLLKETRRAASKKSMEEIFALYSVPVLDSLETAETYMWTNPKNGKSYPRYKLRPVIKHKSIFEFYGCGTHSDNGGGANDKNRSINALSADITQRSGAPDKMPPTGAGECCAPKLIAQAYSLGLRPVSLAEFYYGESPLSGEKVHKQFYEPCDEKCAPILPAMLGLKVLYQDEAIVVVEKPSGLLSVPGRGAEKQDCVVNRVKFLFGGDIGWNDIGNRDLQKNATCVFGADGDTDGTTDRSTTGVYDRDTTCCIHCIEQPAVHRLDMETSGILVLALTEDAHRKLNRQFEEGSVKKQYEAVLDGIPEIIKQGVRNGRLELPFSLDVENRPRQIFDEVYGKMGITDWEFLRYEKGDRVRLLYTPHTGRTHQLRLHSADEHGLGVPIVGDTLYGTKTTSNKPENSNNERLLLHARMLEFTHPVTGERMSFTNPASF